MHSAGLNPRETGNQVCKGLSKSCFPFSQRVGRTGHRLEVKQLPSLRFVSVPSAAQALRYTWLVKNKVCRSRSQELLPPWNCRLREYQDQSCSSGREAGAKPARLRDAVSPSRRRLPRLWSALSPEGSALARQSRGFAPSYPAKRPAALGGDLPVTAAAQTPHLQCGDKLPPSGSPRQQLAAGFPTGPLAALAGRAFSAPLQPLVTSAQRSQRILSNKAGARRRPGEGPSLSAEASEPWQAPTPRQAHREGAAGTRRGERGRKCPAPGAKPSWADPSPPAAPARAHPAFPVGLGRAEGEAVRTVWPDGPAAPLPLSRVSGWTTVNVAMSAVGAEVTLGFSISNRL